MVWFTKGKLWKIGPELPIKFTRLCVTPLNSTSVLFSFIDEEEGWNSFGKMTIFDFLTNKWIDIPKVISINDV